MPQVLSEVHVHALQTTLKRADQAFQAFFNRVKQGQKPGYPRFKGRDFFNSFSFKEYGNGFKLEGKRLKLSRIGRVRIRQHREIKGKLCTCTIKRRADGWYALFTVEQDPVEPNQLNNPVGMDMGLNSFAVLSDGSRIKNPRFLKKAQAELKQAQRILSRKTIGSNRRRKQRDQLARKHLRVQRCRKDFHFKAANELVQRYNPIVFEKLDIKGLIQKSQEDKNKYKRVRAKSENMLDAGWRMFLEKVRSKAESAGSATKAVEPRGTSQKCSDCGQTVKKSLDERRHECPFCGLRMDRDLNAARNILHLGIKDLHLGMDVVELGLVGAGPAGRDQVAELVPMNREATPL